MIDEQVKDNETGLFKQLGKVKSVLLRIDEDHEILTMSLDIDFGGSGQGLGAYSLDTYDKEKKKRVGHAAGTDFILRILNLFHVKTLEEIKGKPVYALRKSDKWGELIVGLRTPAFDGGRVFLISDWQEEWWPEKFKSSATPQS